MSKGQLEVNYDGKPAQIHDALRRTRTDAGLTYGQIAERMGTTIAAVRRIEASPTGEKHAPSFDTLSRYATACGKTLRIAFV